MFRMYQIAVGLVALTADSSPVAAVENPPLKTLEVRKYLHSYTGSTSAFWSSAKFVASAQNDGTIRFWNLPAKDVVNSNKPPSLSFKLPSYTNAHTFYEQYGSLKMICAAHVTIRSSSRRNVALIYDVELNSLQRIIPIEEDAGVMMDEIKAFSISPDGKTLGVVCHYFYPSNSTVLLFDLNEGAKPRTLQGWNESQGTNHSIDFSSDGKLVVADSILRTKSSIERKPAIKIWDAQSGDLKTTIQDLANGWTKVKFSPISKDIAANDGKVIKIWDADKGNLKKTFSGHKELIKAWNYSSDAKMIVSTDGLEIKVWDVATGKEITTVASANATTVDFVHGEPQDAIAVGLGNGALNILKLK